ncbi:MAG TPA: phosphatase PAP2 family protein [Flavitalea sp.]|nr:phosphatase PAP2 family protein [Flavitalea sp.]
MLKRALLPILCCLSFLAINAQDTVTITPVSSIRSDVGVRNNVYHYKPAVDIPYTLAAVAFDLYAFGKIYNKDAPTPGDIDNLKKSNINGFDRWAADVYKGEGPAKTSDLFFYASMPLPLLLFFDHDIRKDMGTVSLIYLETMATNGIFYTGSALAFDRYRPFAYVPTASNPQDPFRIDQQLNGNARNAFLAGHPSLVATSTFFIATVYSDYHPDSKIKWLFYTGAAVATGTTAYLRHLAGRHFPSDLIAGTAAGTLSGILVPRFHKRKQFKNPNLSILPFSGQSHGLVMKYKL